MKRLLIRLGVAILSFAIGVVVQIAMMSHDHLTAQPSTPKVELEKEAFQLVAISKRHLGGRYDCVDATILENGQIWSVGYDGHDPQRMWHSIDGQSMYPVEHNE